MPLVDIHGTRLYVEDSGGDGEPVLFLHGWLSDGRLFHHQIAHLRGRYRCITIDFRGAGRSAPARGGFQLEQHTADVRSVLRELSLDRVHLVGFSVGSWVAMRLAAREPGLALSLTLGNTTGRRQAPAKVPVYLSVAALIRTFGAALPGDLDQGLWGPAFRQDPRNLELRQLFSGRRAELDRRSAVRTLLGFMVRPSMLGELGDITCPTVVVVGGQDQQTPPEEGREVHRAIPHSRLVELPDVGHVAPIEAPDRVTEAVSEVLALAEASGPATR